MDRLKQLDLERIVLLLLNNVNNYNEFDNSNIRILTVSVKYYKDYITKEITIFIIYISKSRE